MANQNSRLELGTLGNWLWEAAGRVAVGYALRARLVPLCEASIK